MKLLNTLLIISSVFITGTAFAEGTAFSQMPFTDVPLSSPNYPAIEFLRTQNVVKGYIDGTFKPNAIINRAEFVEFIINPFILDTNGMGSCVKANAADVAKTVFFSDVPKDAWYAENICFAKVRSIIDGYPNGTFHPEDPINFVEAAKIITNVFSLNISAYQTGEFWFKPYVQSLSDLHAIPPNVTRFSQTLSRADMAQIVYRLKTDSTQKVYMRYDSATNSLSQRTPPPPVVIEPEEATVVARTYDKPSRRSVINAVNERNRLRMTQ